MPVDKTMLAAMLLQNVPTLLQSLKNTVTPSTFDRANDFIINRQYDAQPIGRDIYNKASILKDPDTGLISDDKINTATNDVLDALSEPVTAYNGGNLDPAMEIYNLGNQILNGTATNISSKNPDKTMSALDSAAAMLANGLPTDEQIPNSNTGMSPLDWEWEALEQMENVPAKHQKARQLAQRERASYGLSNFFNDAIRNR